MQHVDRAREPNRVDGAIGIAVTVFDHFEDAASEALQRLGVVRLVAALRDEQRLADLSPHLLRQREQIVVAAAHPPKRLQIRHGIGISI